MPRVAAKRPKRLDVCATLFETWRSAALVEIHGTGQRVAAINK
jgi:hypothetical protein